MTRKEEYLNSGLYRNICQKLNSLVKNAKKFLLDGSHKIENIAQTNVDLKPYIGQHQIKEKLEKKKNAKIVEMNFMLQDGKLKRKEENIAHRNVIGLTNQTNLLGKEIHNILMEEQKNIQKHFIILKSGEILEKRFIKEIIGLAKIRNAKRRVENCMPIIRFQSESAKIHLIKKILLPCAENVMVLNNRREVQNEFFK